MTSKALAPVSPIRLLRDYGWTPELKRRFAVAENLASTIWPWPALQLEIAALDAVVGFPSDLMTRTPRGLFWAMATLYGHEGAGAFDVFFPHGGRRIREDEWLAVMGTVPISLDEKVFGRVIAFAEAARRLHVDERLAGRSRFRRELLKAARANRPLWAGVIEEARQGFGGMKLVDLGDGWVRVEDEESTVALKRVLKRNR